MICAPSNTAIDEIIMRIAVNGLYNENGLIIRPNIVRVGILDKNPHAIIKSLSLEVLAQQELNKIQKFDGLQVYIIFQMFY